ncbi:hypothetical protein Tco_1517812 [Tanacetum coccineum]
MEISIADQMALDDAWRTHFQDEIKNTKRRAIAMYYPSVHQVKSSTLSWKNDLQAEKLIMVNWHYADDDPNIGDILEADLPEAEQLTIITKRSRHETQQLSCSGSGAMKEWGYTRVPDALY